MDKRNKAIKYSLNNIHCSLNDKVKNNRTSTARTPKNLDSLVENRSSYVNRFNSNPVKTHRQMMRSALPFENIFPQTEYQPKAKHFKSNSELNQFVQSHSQKTVKLKLGQKQKCKEKRSKKGKDNKCKKTNKYELNFKSQLKHLALTRKPSASSSQLQVLLKRTQTILNAYKQKQIEWKRERATLMEQLDQLRHKSNGKSLATSSSIYLNKKTLLY